MPPPTDALLLRAARRGDRAAFAQLVRRHYPLLLASCTRMLRDRDLAQDAAQEAVVRAMLGLHALRDDGRFPAWLVGIGLNVARTLISAGHRRAVAEEPITTVDGLRSHDDAPTWGDPVASAEAHELAARVREAIASLPTGQRRAVTLFYLAGLTHAETADELGTASGAVKTRLHKARHHLRASLMTTYAEELPMPQATADAPEFVAMHVAELRRAAADDPLEARHVVFLQDAAGRRMRIWIGLPEATALALILEGVEMPRPGVHQLAAGLLSAAGSAVREVRINALTHATFFAEAILTDGTAVDARPSDAMTLALVTGVPILVAETVIERSIQSEDSFRALIDEAEGATDDAQTIANEARRRFAEAAEPGRTDDAE